MNENTRLRDQEPWKQIVEKLIEDAIYDQMSERMAAEKGNLGEMGE